MSCGCVTCEERRQSLRVVAPTKTAFMLTLDEYERLSAEYLKEFQQVYKGGEFDPALLLSDFLLWLKKKERGNGETKSQD